MLRNISSKQLSEWMAFFRLEPFGFDADMYGHAITSSTIANVNRGKRKRAFSPNDFMPREKEHSTAQSFFAKLKDFLQAKERSRKRK